MSAILSTEQANIFQPKTKHAADPVGGTVRSNVAFGAWWHNRKALK